MAFHYFLCVYCRRFARQTALIGDHLRKQQAKAQMPADMREKIGKSITEKAP